MLRFLLGTIAFFVSTIYVKRYLEGMGIPKGATRSIVVLTIALAISYLVALGVEWLPL